MDMNKMAPIIDVPVNTDTYRKKPEDTSKWIDEVVGVFHDPIIAYPGGWGADIPSWLKEAITLERLIMEMKTIKGERPTATDAEVCFYLSTLSLSVPVDYETARVFQYVFTKVYKFHRNTEVPDDLKVEKLSADEQRLLEQIKNDIYETRMRIRKGELREERAAEKEFRKARAVNEQAKKEEVQPGFDLGI